MPGEEKAATDENTEIDPADISGDADANAKSAEENPDTSLDTELPESDSIDEALGDGVDFSQDRMNPEETAELDLESDDPALLKDKLSKEVARADGNWERVLRMQADMENQRKRQQKDVENARKFALEAVVNDLLPVKDSLEMGISAAREDDADPEKIIEGTDLTLKMLSQAFEKYNIIEINPIDEKFDPEFHQAMSMQEIEGKEPNTVVSVMQKGYTLNDRLVRPALVLVAK